MSIRIEVDDTRLAVAVEEIRQHIEAETFDEAIESVVGGIVLQLLANSIRDLLDQATEEPHYVWTRPDFQRLWRQAQTNRQT